MNTMTSQHEMMIRDAINLLERNLAGDTLYTDELNQTISDLQTILNEAPTSSSANAPKEDLMIYKFDDYFPKVGSNFPKGAA